MLDITNAGINLSLSPTMESDYSAGSDSEATARDDQDYTGRASSSATRPHQHFLIPQRTNSGGRVSLSSTASSTPLPSRAPSPLPRYYHHQHHPSSSCPSDSETELNSPLIRSTSSSSRYPWIRESRRSSSWWSAPRRRSRNTNKVARTLRRWMRYVVRHPLFPAQPITLVLTLILLSILAIFITLLLIYILNPDKEPLPWRAYCSIPSLAQPMEPHFPKQHIYPEYEAGQMISPFPPSNLDDLPPAGVFVGVFSIDSAFERRMLVRTTWASHPRSRDGAVGGDAGRGTSRTVVRFILGLPRKDWERRVKLEMEMYNDIVILPIPENMNSGKTHSFFSWASLNAWVPPLYSDSEVPLPQFSYSNYTATPPSLAPHDPFAAWENIQSGQVRSWVRPDFVVKVDDDSFVMLAELESRLRFELHQKPKAQNSTIVNRRAGTSSATTTSPSSLISESSSTSITSPAPSASDPSSPDSTPDERDTTDEDDTPSTTVGTPKMTTRTKSSAATTSTQLNTAPSYPESLTDNDPLIYWGYLVTNRLHQFMAGELYALSWSLVDWVAKDATVKTMTKGAEDKQTSKWMRAHPRADKVRWTSERCWIYDHPRSSTVYSHGFLFPSEVTRIKRAMMAYVEKWTTAQALGSSGHSNSAPSSSQLPTPAAWSESSVSNFGVRYVPPLPDLSMRHSVEALVEGSEMSTLREGSPMTPEHAWVHREGRNNRFEGKRVGGTIVVHFIKKNMWYLETALALLEGEEVSEAERYEPAPNEEVYEEAYWSKWTHNNFQRQRQKTLRPLLSS